MSLWTWSPALCRAQKANPVNLGTKREALHVQDEEGMRQACIGARVDAGTHSPAINSLICQWTACNSGEIHMYLSTGSRHQQRSTAQETGNVQQDA